MFSFMVIWHEIHCLLEKRLSIWIFDYRKDSNNLYNKFFFLVCSLDFDCTFNIFDGTTNILAVLLTSVIKWFWLQWFVINA